MLLFSLLFAALTPVQTDVPVDDGLRCAVDHQIYNQSIDAFDQDLEGGWRELANRHGCKAAAAELIRNYRVLQQARISSLYWHEGQLRAELGQVGEAVLAMSQARHTINEDGWNEYVDATIAFLQNDLPALKQARYLLAAVEAPKDYKWIDFDGTTKMGKPSDWPYNLDVVDGLIACFGKTYREAYSLMCRPSQPEAR